MGQERTWEISACTGGGICRQTTRRCSAYIRDGQEATERGMEMCIKKGNKHMIAYSVKVGSRVLPSLIFTPMLLLTLIFCQCTYHFTCEVSDYFTRGCALN